MLVSSPHIPLPSHLFYLNVRVKKKKQSYYFTCKLKKILSWEIHTKIFARGFKEAQYFFSFFKFWQIRYIAVLWYNVRKTSCFTKCQRKCQVTLWAMLIAGSYEVRRWNVKPHLPDVILLLLPSWLVRDSQILFSS